MLSKILKKDAKTDSILNILDNATWFEGKLIEDKEQMNLRSFVAHKQSISEGLRIYFEVHRLSQEQVLLYDMVSRDIPFFKTAYDMGKNLSYVILNILATFTTEQIFGFDSYNPSWKNRSVILSDFSPKSSDRLKIPVVSKMTLSGFQYSQMEVDKGILTHAISFAATLLKQVKDLSKSGWTEIGQLPNGKILMLR